MVDPKLQKALIDAFMNLTPWFEKTFPGEVMKRGLKDATGSVYLDTSRDVTIDKLSISRFDGVHRMNATTFPEPKMRLVVGFKSLEITGHYHGNPTMIGEGTFTETFDSLAEGMPAPFPAIVDTVLGKNFVEYWLELDDDSFIFSNVEILGTPLVTGVFGPGDFPGRMKAAIPKILYPSLTHSLLLTFNKKLSV